jgi:hypothetical protein
MLYELLIARWCKWLLLFTVTIYSLQQKMIGPICLEVVFDFYNQITWFTDLKTTTCRGLLVTFQITWHVCKPHTFVADVYCVAVSEIHVVPFWGVLLAELLAQFWLLGASNADQILDILRPLQHETDYSDSHDLCDAPCFQTSDVHLFNNWGVSKSLFVVRSSFVNKVGKITTLTASSFIVPPNATGRNVLLCWAPNVWHYLAERQARFILYVIDWLNDLCVGGLADLNDKSTVYCVRVLEPDWLTGPVDNWPECSASLRQKATVEFDPAYALTTHLRKIHFNISFSSFRCSVFLPYRVPWIGTTFRPVITLGPKISVGT